MQDHIVTGFKWVPPFAQGLNRDLRVRWALEEAAIPHEVALIDLEARTSEAYRRKQPFGMIPVLSSGGREWFESGAIVHLIAEKSEALMPSSGSARAETVIWMYAALDTVEPPLYQLATLDLQHGAEEWARLSRPRVVEKAHARLAALATRLEGRDFLVGRFTAADILMATVLRFVRHTDLVSSHPVVHAYLDRCEARPAFEKVLQAQMAQYASNAPAA